MVCCGDSILASTTTPPPPPPPVGSNCCLRTRYVCVCIAGVDTWVLDVVTTACVDPATCVGGQSCTDTEFVSEIINGCICGDPLPPLPVPTCDPHCCTGDETTTTTTTPPPVVCTVAPLTVSVGGFPGCFIGGVYGCGFGSCVPVVAGPVTTYSWSPGAASPKIRVGFLAPGIWEGTFDGITWTFMPVPPVCTAGLYHGSFSQLLTSPGWAGPCFGATAVGTF